MPRNINRTSRILFAGFYFDKCRRDKPPIHQSNSVYIYIIYFLCVFIFIWFCSWQQFSRNIYDIFHFLYLLAKSQLQVLMGYILCTDFRNYTSYLLIYLANATLINCHSLDKTRKKAANIDILFSVSEAQQTCSWAEILFIGKGLNIKICYVFILLVYMTENCILHMCSQSVNKILLNRWSSKTGKFCNFMSQSLCPVQTSWLPSDQLVGNQQKIDAYILTFTKLTPCSCANIKGEVVTTSDVDPAMKSTGNLKIALGHLIM